MRVGNVTGRLHGLDAPEKRQIGRRSNVDWFCGQAAAWLRQRVGQSRLDCRERDGDRYGRLVATCRAGATELNREILRAGPGLDLVGA